MTSPHASLNGRNGAFHAAQAALAAQRPEPWSRRPDPLERVLDLGHGRGTLALAVAFVMTFSIHGVAAVRTAYIHVEMIRWTQRLDAVIDSHLVQTIDIETDKPPQQKPPPEEEKKQDDPPVVKQEVTPQQAPAAAAQAGQILSQKEDEVLNFTGEVFTVGNSDRFAGGDTTSKGTSAQAVHAQHVADNGAGNGQGQAQAAVVAVDLSRTAQLAGSGEWRCPFPPEADADQVDEAAAIIEVTVGADGKASRAAILQDPGHGFGREARSCAMREAYVPALDREGRAVSSTKRFRVKFER